MEGAVIGAADSTDVGEAETKSLARTTESVSRAQLKSEKIKVLGARRPLTVEAGTPLADALAVMRTGGGECVLVCRGDRPIGILTERDVLTKVLGQDFAPERPVDEVMTPDPEALTAEATIGEALALMDRGGFRNVPLTDRDGRLAGLLRQQDVLEYVAEAFPQEILNLPPRPHQTMDQEGA